MNPELGPPPTILSDKIKRYLENYAYLYNANRALYNNNDGGDLFPMALIFSLLLIVVSIFSLSINGLKFGIDFTGGTLLEVGYQRDVDLADVCNRA
jgi:hypothetical protein